MSWLRNLLSKWNHSDEPDCGQSELMTLCIQTVMPSEVRCRFNLAEPKKVYFQWGKDGGVRVLRPTQSGQYTYMVRWSNPDLPGDYLFTWYDYHVT